MAIFIYQLMDIQIVYIFDYSESYCVVMCTNFYVDFFLGGSAGV
jgi:ascorbate-specific PTS system EIIC-type component UlaA